MYFGKNIKLLSKTLIWAAIVNILMEGMYAAIRLTGRRISAMPDMLSGFYAMSGTLINAIKLAALGCVFIYSMRKVRHYKSLVDSDEMEEIRRLQEEFLGRELSTLRADTTEYLIRIWAGILIGAELVYNITSGLYTKMIQEMVMIISGGTGSISEQFTALYNSTHGFKYIGMLVAIALGIYITGVILKDRWLVSISAAMIGLFLFVFAFVEISTVTLMGNAVGIVWTSVMCHMLETVGILSLAVYISLRYKGV